MEAAIQALAVSVKSGEDIPWPPTKRGKVEVIRTHETIHNELKALVKETGYRQNVVVLAAMQRWLNSNKS